MSALVLLACLLPLAAITVAPRADLRGPARVVAALPLLALGALGEGALLAPEWLLGSALGVDAVNRPLLLLAGAGWMLGGHSVEAWVRERAGAFHAAWCLVLLGQALVLLAADMASFYLGYVLMTLAAYALVVHARGEEAMRAGRVYLVLALAGEAMLLSGLLLLGAAHGNAGFEGLHVLPPVAWAPGLLLAGFAVKLGVVPLHVWLPLAHPVAPVPASAVLSGLLVKAGLLGVLRFVPGHALPGPEWLLAVGLGTAVYGAVVGLAQARLKTVLAYSTISQMGLAVAGLAALAAGAEGMAIAALGLFALHHGLNKIALFLAAGHRLGSRLAQLAFLLPAASLAGLPWSSGALAKSALKQGLEAGGLSPWALGFSLSSVLTTVLLLHAWTLAQAARQGRDSPHPAWMLAVGAGLVLPWAWFLSQGTHGPGLGHVLDATWPALAGASLWWLLRGRLGAQRLPEGDLVVLGEAGIRRLAPRFARPVDAWLRWSPSVPDPWPSAERLARLEIALARLPVAGLCLLALVLGIWWLLA